MNKTLSCPCKSGQLYKNCCKRLHEGAAPNTAIDLMRSRFSAYALCLCDYIVKTTDPETRQANLNSWKKDILQFSKQTKFEGLRIIDSSEVLDTATVTFTAILKQGKNDVSFTERSNFVKKDNFWYYKTGTAIQPE